MAAPPPPTTPPAPDPAAVAAALERVHDPCSVASGAPLGLGAMGLVRSCEVDGDAVRVTLGVTGPGCTFTGLLLDRAADAVRAVPGVRTVDVALDTSFVWDPDALAPGAARALEQRRARTLTLSAVRPRQWEEG
jgi:metal-sulfur cluster biosynthetic enzyme